MALLFPIAMNKPKYYVIYVQLSRAHSFAVYNTTCIALMYIYTVMLSKLSFTRVKWLFCSTSRNNRWPIVANSKCKLCAYDNISNIEGVNYSIV